MRRFHPLAHVFGAAIALIVLCLAPSGAQAHGGHAHQAPAASSVDLLDDKDAGPAIVESVTIKTDQQYKTGCGGLLCCSTACAACGYVVIGAAVLAAPAGLSAVLPLLDASGGSGIGPQDLQRPPQSFV